MIFPGWTSTLRFRLALSLSLLGALWLGVGCQKRSPSSSRKDAAAPTATPLPAHRAYVAKSFSIVTDSGVTGFPVGKEVTLIREEKDKFIISDGSQLHAVPKSSFTRDPAILNQLKERPAANVATPAAKPPEQSSNSSFSNPVVEIARLVDAQLPDSPEHRRRELRRELAVLEQRIADAREEIATKQATQRPVRITYDAYGRVRTYQGKSAYTLSADASEAGMKELMRRRDALMRDLSRLPPP